MTKQMIPTGGQKDGEMGLYELLDVEQSAIQPVAEQPIPEAQVQSVIRQRVSEKPHRSIANKLVRSVKLVGVGVLAVGVGLVANEIREFGLGIPEAKQEIEVEVGPANTKIDENVYINLSTMTSRFPMEVKTSLDRFGPSNCDVSIIMTDEDEQVKTTTNGGIIFDQLDTTPNEDGTYDVSTSGRMVLTPSSVVWTETPILFEEDLVWADTCFDFNEPNKAMDIAVTTVQQAGQLAAACAVGSRPGKQAIESGIKQYLRMVGTVPADTPNTDIDVDMTNLEEQQKAVYGEKVQLFDQIVGDKIDHYLKDTEDHELKSNFDDIKDCRLHDITFSAQQ
jgi:hypothetical protein